MNAKLEDYRDMQEYISAEIRQKFADLVNQQRALVTSVWMRNLPYREDLLKDRRELEDRLRKDPNFVRGLAKIFL